VSNNPKEILKHSDDSLIHVVVLVSVKDKMLWKCGRGGRIICLLQILSKLSN
jgi:hypothetical protein